MGKKTTKQSAKTLVESTGYIFHEFEPRFNNNRNDFWINVSCGKHLPYWVRVGHFKKGQRCKKCLSESQIKWHNNDIIEYITNNNYVFVKFITENLGNNTRILIQCLGGHEPYEVKFNNFLNGKRCAWCANCHKLNYDIMKEDIESDGNYELLSTEYVNNCTLVDIKCKYHNYIYSTSYASWRSGARCKLCRNDELSIDRRYSLSRVKSNIEKCGKFVLLSDVYINNTQTLKIKCNKCNSIFDDTYAQFNSKKNCKVCERGFRYSENELLDYFSRALNLTGEIPNTKDLSRLNFPANNTYIQRFGSIANIFKLLDIDINDYLTDSQYGNICVDKNGELCRSRVEKNISNFLIDNNIKHEKEILYSRFINTRRLYRFDWVVQKDNDSICIEYFGLYNPNKKSEVLINYCKKVKNKESILKQHGLIETSILIYPNDYKNKTLEEIFEIIL